MALSNTVHPQRGYLANIFTIPPLIYPFQYNPSKITDQKKLEWGTKNPTAGQGLPGLLGGAASIVGSFQSGGFFSGVGALAGQGPEILGRTFSKAELKQLSAEKERTVSFSFMIDGREKRSGEPDRRRNEDGDILGDIAILRSFVYPQLGNMLDILATAFGAEGQTWTDIWFNEPPTALIVMGDMSMEGFVTDLKITETLFNDDLNPTRAEVEITLIEKIDSLTFAIDSFKRIGRAFYYTAYEDIGDVLF